MRTRTCDHECVESPEARFEALVAKCGPREVRLIEPTAEFFPDAFTRGDDESIAALTRRMLSYAGQDNLAIEIVPFEERCQTTDVVNAIHGGDDRVKRVSTRTGPATLLSVAVDRCTIGVADAEPEMLACALARVASRLFLERPAESYRDAPVRELAATDEALGAAEIASVYLGFGVLTANDAYRFVRSRRTVTHRSCGIHSYEAMTLLLAKWWRERGGEPAERRRIRALLEPSQLTTFDQA